MQESKEPLVASFFKDPVEEVSVMGEWTFNLFHFLLC